MAKVEVQAAQKWPRQAGRSDTEAVKANKRYAWAAAGLVAVVLSSSLSAQADDGPSSIGASTTTAAVQFSSVREARAVVDSAKSRLRRAQETDAQARERSMTAQTQQDKAEAALSEAQVRIDQLVRAMYMAGGSNQTSTTLLLLAPGEDVQAAVSTAAYLDSTATATADALDTAARQSQQASTETAIASSQAQASAAELEAATQALEDAQKQFTDYVTGYIPADGRVLTDPLTCANPLARRLAAAGFAGEDLREAWAIAMRESGGNPTSISPTQDYGVFQINKPTWGSQEWWDDEAMLTAEYNIAIAAKLSDYGRNWLPWGLDGHGRANPLVYERSGWTQQQILDWIVTPYVNWYKKYPCLSPATNGAAGGPGGADSQAAP